MRNVGFGGGGFGEVKKAFGGEDCDLEDVGREGWKSGFGFGEAVDGGDSGGRGGLLNSWDGAGSGTKIRKRLYVSGM